MKDSESKAKIEKRQAGQVTSSAGEAFSKGGQARSKSMHDGVPVWYDCCSCEAEPYWLELMDRNDP